MAALQPLCVLFGINPKKFSHFEHILLEAELFLRITKELIEVYREQHKEFFCLIQLSKEKKYYVRKKLYSFNHRRYPEYKRI